jgi:hypothetical protein
LSNAWNRFDRTSVGDISVVALPAAKKRLMAFDLTLRQEDEAGSRTCLRGSETKNVQKNIWRLEVGFLTFLLGFSRGL